MKKILVYTLSLSLFAASCTANNKPVASCCKKPRTEQKAVAATLPEESIYADSDVFTDQDGKSVQLKDFAGKVTVTSMVYTSCTYACPRLTNDIKAISDKLNAAGIKDVNYVLVSFDTERDNPAHLKAFAGKMGLDKNWTLLRGSDDAVRQLSVLLNVQYEKSPDGNFAHSNLITVLDQQGRVATQLEGLQANNSETVASIKDLAAL